MLPKITITCFAASYTVALALELARFVLRGSWRGALALGFIAAGWLAQTLFLGYRAATDTAMPLSSAFDWYLVVAWLLASLQLYLSIFHRRWVHALFILPIVLALIATAHWASRQPFAQLPASRFWVVVHATIWSLGAVAVSIGFVAGLMYLLQARRLKHKLPAAGKLRLPSLEWLERINRRAIVVSVLTTGVGLVSGLVLNLVNHSQQQGAVPWTDPIVWESAVLFGWLLAAALFSALYRPARGGRKVAYLTVASFVFLALFLAVQLFNAGEHGGKPQEAAAGVDRAKCLATTRRLCAAERGTAERAPLRGLRVAASRQGPGSHGGGRPA